MTEVGTVVGVDGGDLLVSIRRESGCGKNCMARRRCALGSEEGLVSRASNECGAVLGDRVELGHRPGAVGKAVLVAYGTPFASMILGFALGHALFGAEREVPAFALGIGFLAAGFAVLKLLDRRRSVRGLMPVAVGIRPADEGGGGCQLESSRASSD